MTAINMMAQTKYDNINNAIEKGEFTTASELINKVIAEGNLSDGEIYDLSFQIERMNRIRKDFKLTEEDVLAYVKKYYPDVKSADLIKWEDDRSLEFKIIDGEKLYFNRSRSNLFRINKEAKEQKLKVDGYKKDDLDEFLESYLKQVVDKVKDNGSPVVMPVKIKLKYSLVVDPEVVPGGEIIRCWLPYPREGHSRQTDINLLSVNNNEYIVAPNNYLQRTLYLEKMTVKGEPTRFEYELEYTGKNEWYKITADQLKPYNKNSEIYKHYTSERPPHIVFTDKIKKLSDEIVGDETDPYLIGRKIYKWINDNIPWAGAREYSTISNISDYCLTTGHGDCGIKTLTFMTLARYNGIPVKWQSGLMLHPNNNNLHDWGEMYFEGYGWVPVDQSFGLTNSEDEDVEWFFFGGIDAFHFIVNDDYSQPLYPAKIFPRSETVDFQRGEVEWRGGNLYFDKWDYFMEVDYFFED
ncbi:MAG: transglutaminase domain-containing protein [Melioribacteraceae bacterium]|nr:transglutaminase domain-containing protein [Melioribacteraceae bacterium]